jgi:hypothetical protein
MKSTHFYSMKNVSLPDILAYLNKFAENENGKIVRWQIVEASPDRVFPPENAKYSCVIEFETMKKVE